MEEVFALSDGNPYLVSELVASAIGSTVPPTVVDAVLGRLAPAHQDIIELLAVVPSALDRKLVDALASDHPAIEAAEERGLLTVQPEQISFRHELTRRAIADALPVARRLELNARVLSAMEDLGIYDASRLVHHASEAGDVDALVRYAPIAARDAATSGAHREAAAHFALALAHENRFTPPELADLFEECAVERSPSALQLMRCVPSLRLAGPWRLASCGQSWAELGCPYHQAAALADSQDPATLLEALPILDSLGATPLARQVRAGLRQLGVPNVPRGPVAGTRENPAGLTDRQLEVLRLLARGLTNGEIATQLVLSVRTVDRHVAEILAKLGVASRRQAAARAETLGIASPRP